MDEVRRTGRLGRKGFNVVDHNVVDHWQYDPKIWLALCYFPEKKPNLFFFWAYRPIWAARDKRDGTESFKSKLCSCLAS